MKNNKLLWSFVIIMLTTCQMKTFGQTEIVSSAPVTDPIIKTIVRHYQNDDVISYVQTDSNSYFTLSDAQTYHKIATIDHRFVVNDMEIYKGHVYFCGVDNASQTGFIGFFRITDFFNGTDFYRIFSCIPYSSSTTVFVSDLNRLTVFKNNSGLHVAAIGHVDDPNNSSCIVDYLPHATTGNNYSVGIASATGIQSDFLDITSTDNYVVVSDMVMSGMPTLRAFDINNLFATGGIQDYQYLFCEYLDNMIFNYDDLLIEHINSDIVATATYWKDQTSSNMFDGTNIRFFDINQMLTIPYMGMLYSFGIHQPFCFGIWDLYELRNDPNNQCLYLLQRADEPSAPRRNACFVNEFHYSFYPPTGLVNGCYIPSYMSQSLDVFNSYSISTGYNVSNNDNLKYHLKSSFQQGGCSTTVFYSYSNYHVSQNKIDYSPLNVYSSELYPVMLWSRVDENEISIVCYN